MSRASFFKTFLLTEMLPAPNEPWVFGAGFYLSKGGISFPLPQWAFGHASALFGFALGLVALFYWRRRQFQRFERTGEAPRLWLPGLALPSLGTLLGWMMGGAPTEMRYPEMGAFAIDGGGALTPEFLAVLIGLTLYTAGFIAEVVRAGIQSVPRGQGEAAQSLGLSAAQEMRLVLLPSRNYGESKRWLCWPSVWTRVGSWLPTARRVPFDGTLCMQACW